MPLDAERALSAARFHWGIENGLHWVLDVAFDEDNSRAYLKNAQATWVALRHLAMNLLKRDPWEPRTSKQGWRPSVSEQVGTAITSSSSSLRDFAVALYYTLVHEALIEEDRLKLEKLFAETLANETLTNRRQVKRDPGRNPFPRNRICHNQLPSLS